MGPGVPPRQPELDTEDLSPLKPGTVKFYDEGRGFGFIMADSGEQAFFHCTNIIDAGDDEVKQGDRVLFQAADFRRGLHAVRVLKDFEGSGVCPTCGGEVK